MEIWNTPIVIIFNLSFIEVLIYLKKEIFL